MRATALLLVSIFAITQFSAGTPEDGIVPEEALTTRQNPLTVIDDPEDAKPARKDYLGRNSITGKIMTKGSDGTTDGHLVYNPIQGRDFVKNPGYTTKDAWLSPGGPAEGGGAYYLGTGRRRIGAGFGRRRRAVELPMTKAEKAKAKAQMGAILKDPSKLKSILHFAHSMTSGYGADEKKNTKVMAANLEKKAKDLMAGLTKKQFDQLALEWFGMQTGPTFFPENNYKGTLMHATTSISDMSSTGKIDINELASLKVPAGWKVELFTEKDYGGESIKFDGPKNVWSLSKSALTLHYGEVCGGGSCNKGYQSKQTTWMNEVASMKITRYDFVVKPPTSKCPSSCGIDKFEYTGKVICERSGGVQKKATVPNADCLELKLTEPKLPKKRCLHTQKCAKFESSKPTGKCTTTCGFPGATLKGKVWCETRKRVKSDGKLPKEASATKVTPKKTGENSCTHWQLKKPATPTKTCAKTPRCVKWVVKHPTCPTACGTAASTKYTSSSCVAKVGGATASASECAHWGLTKPGRQAKHCPRTAPCPTPAPTMPQKKPCSTTSLHGFSTFAWDPRGRYCYRVLFGSYVQQDWNSNAAKCARGQFHANVYIGKYTGNPNFYTHGTYCGAAGADRTVAVSVRQDPGIAQTTAHVTEPRTCKYQMDIVQKSCRI
jgi:hypothetical protein